MCWNKRDASISKQLLLHSGFLSYHFISEGFPEECWSQSSVMIHSPSYLNQLNNESEEERKKSFSLKLITTFSPPFSVFQYTPLTNILLNYLPGTGGEQWPLPAPTLEAFREAWLIDWNGWIYSGTGRKNTEPCVRMRKMYVSSDHVNSFCNMVHESRCATSCQLD